MSGGIKIYVLADDYAGQDSAFWAQHGIALWIEVETEKGKKVILFDTGSYGELVLHNMKMLGLSAEKIDLIVLSHNHYDHTGGLLPVLEAAKKESIPVVVHPEAFKVSFSAEHFWESVGMPQPQAERAARLGAQWVPCASPMQLGAGILYSGEIPRQTDFENTKGLGLYTLVEGKAEEDHLFDDVALYFSTPKGLVVVSGCAHAGIVNIAKQGLAITGAQRVAAVVGGLHLFAADQERIEKTAAALREMGVEKFYTGHCTGLKAESYFLNHFGEKFKKLHCGKAIAF